MRQRILGAGPSAVGKTEAGIDLARAFVDNAEWAKIANKAGLPSDQIEVYAIDHQDGIEPLVEYYQRKDGEEFPNLHIFKCGGEQPLVNIEEALFGPIDGEIRRMRKAKVDAHGRRMDLEPDDVFNLGLDEAGIQSWLEASRLAIARTYNLIPQRITLPHWIFADMVGEWWDFAQEYYAQLVLGKEHVGELVLEAKIKKEHGERDSTVGGFGNRDTGWGDIKKLYKDSAGYLMQRAPCNIYGTTNVADLPVDASGNPVNKGSVTLFAKFKVRPMGHWSLLGEFDRALLFKRDGRLHTFALGKDRPAFIKAVTDNVNWTKPENFWSVYAALDDRPEDYVPGLTELMAMLPKEEVKVARKPTTKR